MKRTLALAGMLAIAAISLVAAAWDGSAVAGGLGDFPDDGLYGACNSFPHDTSVKVTNLENGKAVIVTITRNVDNPGVFIALSPKAAAALGMQAGTSARIRANALTASQAETSLPPARAGETSDPDYNPKIYVDREKAAVAANSVADGKTATGQAAAPIAPVAPGVPVPTTAPPAVASTPLPLEASSVASQKAAAALPASTESAAASGVAQGPEVIADNTPEPSKAQAVPLTSEEPSLPTESAATEKGKTAVAAETPEKASPEFAPEELPDIVLSRITSPAKLEPEPKPKLAEAVPLDKEKGSGESEPEALALEKPSYAKTVEEANLAELQTPDQMSSAGHDTGTAIALEKPAMAGTAGATELASPSEPKPRESIADEHPASGASVEETVTLEPASPKPPERPVKALTETPAAAEKSEEAAAPRAEVPEAVATVKSASSADAAQVPSSVPLIKGLAKGSFYVQIGVYGTNEALQAAVTHFKATYPLAVESVKTKKGVSAYRLFVGPLSRDEGGVVLMRIRSLGFKDAYVRQGS